MRTCLLLPALLLASCKTTAHLHPDLGTRGQDIARALLQHRKDVLPPPPALYLLPGSFVDLSFGAVVATDGPIFAVRFEEPERLPDRPLHMLVPVSVADGASIIGDGVVAHRMGDILICRFFPRPPDSTRLPALGDKAWLDEFTRPAPE